MTVFANGLLGQKLNHVKIFSMFRKQIGGCSDVGVHSKTFQEKLINLLNIYRWF